MIEREVTDRFVVFQNHIGKFVIPHSLNSGVGVGYVSRWTRLNDVLITDAAPAGYTSSSGYLNNPANCAGIGAFGCYIAFGNPPWRYWGNQWGGWPPATAWCSGNRLREHPGVTKVGEPEIGATYYTQNIELANGLITLRPRIEIDTHSVSFNNRVQINPGNYWLKEPEFGVHMIKSAGIKEIVTPLTSCPSYSGLTDPTKRTGRCNDPNRRVVLCRGLNDFDVRVAVADLSWRRLAAVARNWPRAGDQGCMGHQGFRTQPYDNWEYVAWKANSQQSHYDSLALLFKAWEGCVSGLDAPAFYRRPIAVSVRNYSFTIKRN